MSSSWTTLLNSPIGLDTIDKGLVYVDDYSPCFSYVTPPFSHCSGFRINGSQNWGCFDGGDRPAYPTRNVFPAAAPVPTIPDSQTETVPSIAHHDSPAGT